VLPLAVAASAVVGAFGFAVFERTDGALPVLGAVIPLHHESANRRATPDSYPVRVYFPRRPESNEDTKAVFPVPRAAPDLGVARYAVGAIVAGPTDAERAAGYFSALLLGGASDCGGDDFTITIREGTAVLRFCRTFVAVSSRELIQVFAQLNTTLRAFPSITETMIVMRDGRCLFDGGSLRACAPGASTDAVLPAEGDE
jgi:hypothetical protein